MSAKSTAAELDALLPQTQCGLCGYGGCMPYAEAMIEANAPINLCPPGGLATLLALAQRLNQDASSYREEMEKKAKAKSLAVIREKECIGCTKCIQVCPVDAIIGSAKQMHTVIHAICTGCELCVPVCPTDCIDMETLIPAPTTLSSAHITQANTARARFQARTQRLARGNQPKPISLSTHSLASKKEYLQAAIARANNKKKKL